jgi:hypothetical protein
MFYLIYQYVAVARPQVTLKIRFYQQNIQGKRKARGRGHLAKRFSNFEVLCGLEGIWGSSIALNRSEYSRNKNLNCMTVPQVSNNLGYLR